MRPDLTAVNARVSRYHCGECGHDQTAPWAAHQAHHETHEVVTS